MAPFGSENGFFRCHRKRPPDWTPERKRENGFFSVAPKKTLFFSTMSDEIYCKLIKGVFFGGTGKTLFFSTMSDGIYCKFINGVIFGGTEKDPRNGLRIGSVRTFFFFFFFFFFFLFFFFFFFFPNVSWGWKSFSVKVGGAECY